MPLIVELPNRLWHEQMQLTARCWQHAALAAVAAIDRLRCDLIDPWRLIGELPDSPASAVIHRFVPPTRQRVHRLHLRTDAAGASAIIRGFNQISQRADRPPTHLVQGFVEELYFYHRQKEQFRSHDFGQHLELDLGPAAEARVSAELQHLGLSTDHLWRA